MECKKCGSTTIVKNGRTATGQQQYHCRACGVYTVTDDRARERALKMELVEKLHRERVSQRGIARVTGISRPTIIRWLRKKVLRPIGATILPTATRPKIEIDEQWSYVGTKGDVMWHWVAVERSTKRGDGHEVTDDIYGYVLAMGKNTISVSNFMTTTVSFEGFWSNLPLLLPQFQAAKTCPACGILAPAPMKVTSRKALPRKAAI